MRKVFFDIFKNIQKIFSGKNLLWFFLAFFLTWVIVASGFDWTYFVFAQKIGLKSFLFPAVLIGGILPLLLVIFSIFPKKENGHKFLSKTLPSLSQSIILGWLVSSFLKAFTGRIPPPHNFNYLLTPDNSHGFQFGILKGGIFWGWPSSHTTIAFAMSLTLWQLYPEKKFLRFFALLYAFYVGLGVSTGIHWFSEFIAGAIIGSIIGLQVGKSFQKK